MEAPIYFIHTEGVGFEDRHYEDLEEAKEKVLDLKKLRAYRDRTVRIREFFSSNITDNSTIVWELP